MGATTEEQELQSSLVRCCTPPLSAEIKEAPERIGNALLSWRRYVKARLDRLLSERSICARSAMMMQCLRYNAIELLSVCEIVALLV